MTRLLKYKLVHSTLALIISAMLFFSCKKGTDEQDYSDYFSFDKNLTGMEVVDQELGLKFYPPKNWELQQTSISKKIETRDSANPKDNFVYSPTYIFFEKSTGGLLSVGKVVTADTTLAKSARLNFYKGLISTKHKNDKLVSGDFVHSKIYFSQFKIEKYNLVSFKLFFLNLNSEIIEFDYTIPANYLEGIQPSIKSSIGSIRLQ
ncbi:hypothetical protein C0389_08415 [bacterium]|nr:hypothetical protein [bacterium]